MAGCKSSDFAALMMLVSNPKKASQEEVLARSLSDEKHHQEQSPAPTSSCVCPTGRCFTEIDLKHPAHVNAEATLAKQLLRSSDGVLSPNMMAFPGKDL